MTQIGLTNYIESIIVTSLSSSFSQSNIILGVSKWQNPGNRFDVLADDSIDINDYNTIVNYIAENGSGVLPKVRPSNQPYVDVNGDGIVDDKDLAQMLNYLKNKNLVDNTVTKSYVISDIKIQRDLVNPSLVAIIKDVASTQNVFPLSDYVVYKRNLATNDLTEASYTDAVASRDSLVFIAIDAIEPVHEYKPGCRSGTYDESCTFDIIKSRIAASEILPIRFNKIAGATGVIPAGTGLPLPGTDTSEMPAEVTVAEPAVTTTDAVGITISTITIPPTIILDTFPSPVAIIGDVKMVCLSIDGADNTSTTACTAKMTSNTAPSPYVVSADSEETSVVEKWYYSAGDITNLCVNSGLNGTWLINTSDGAMNYDTTTLNEIAAISCGAGATVISAEQSHFTLVPSQTKSYAFAYWVAHLCRYSGLPGADTINISDGSMNYDSLTMNIVAQIALGNGATVVSSTVGHYYSPHDNYISYWNGSRFICLNAADTSNNFIDKITVTKAGHTYYLSNWDGTSFRCSEASVMGNNMVSQIGCRNVTSANPAYKAFDQTTDYWISGSATTHWLQYDFNSGVVVNKYALQEAIDDGFPTDFQLYGSNNASDWTLLDTRNSISPPGEYSWTPYFTFVNGTEYRYYKLVINAVSGGGLIARLAELKLVCLSIDGADNSSTSFCTTIMSSDVLPTPSVVVASSEYYSEYRDTYYSGWKAFNQTNTGESDRWMSSASIAPWFISYDFGYGASKVINKYAIQQQNYSGMSVVNGSIVSENNYDTNAGFPKDFVLQGSNDNSVWVTLDTRTNVSAPGTNSWSNYLTFKNGTTYQYYRIYITAINGNMTTVTTVSNADCKVTASTYSTIRNVVITQYNESERTAQFTTAGQTQTTLYAGQELLITCNVHDYYGVYAIELWVDGILIDITTGPTVNTSIGGMDFTFDIGTRSSGIHTYSIIATDNNGIITSPAYSCWFTVLDGA
ncbi:MAG: discoidin domain-containing protein [Candidatus Cloacimonetes bacterium]|jgi:hypothetical protein|nr:discoidin domain-containing protein [Candidatus Cloacimonadota bacterium]